MAFLLFFWVGGAPLDAYFSLSLFFVVPGGWVGDFCYLLHLASLSLAPRSTWSTSTRSRCHGSASCCPPSLRRGFPLCRFFSVFLGLVAFLLFFWVGGAPLAAFFSLSLFFVVPVVGSGISATCCILRLFLLQPRKTWSTDPQPPRPLQPFALARPASPVSCWESSAGRAEVKGCRVTAGGL